MPDLTSTIAELITRPGHEKVRVLVDRILVSGLRVESRDIDFEKPVPEVHGRIDALLGRSIFEFKSDLSSEREDAERQLTSYLGEREQATGHRYVGLATDGATFTAYERTTDGMLRELSGHVPSVDGEHALLAWLQTVLAVGHELRPDPERVRQELGRDSPAYRRAQGELAVLWGEVARQPDVLLKRKLWGDYLEHVYGTRVGADELFLQHTYLSTVAKTMATSVLGVVPADAASLLRGAAFDQAGISGAVESDFFDWILAASGGEQFVMRLARQVSRFRLADVEHDVMKGLYESLIDPEQRHDLGEYYTPDWLAARMCERAIDRPLEQRVLDPACGSGTFLFYGVRQYLAAAEAAGRVAAEALDGCMESVIGIDVHPVAVAIARVTFLLAIGEARLRDRPARLTVPVYLGDSLQWNTEGFFGRTEVRVQVPDGTVLHFPAHVAEDASQFDATVQAMIDYAEPPASEPPAFRKWLRGHEITDSRDIETLERTYKDLVVLRQTGRDHIWGYVLRNLSRPFSLSAPARRVDVVIGNPPWLSYRYMARPMQQRFKEECRERRLWTGGKVATHQDLSAYFFARSAELYLKDGGTIGFVMPYAALTRQQFRGFHSQQFGKGQDQIVRFEEVWTFGDQVTPLFPVPSCAIFAEKGAEGPRPEEVLAFSGVLPRRDASTAEAESALMHRREPWPAAGEGAGSAAYARAFRQGATVVPRRLWVVERVSAGRFGSDPDAPLVRSRQSRQEKEPWRRLEPLQGNIERRFLRPLYLGESLAPFRLLEPVEAIIPHDRTQPNSSNLLTAARARALGYPGLSRWLMEADGLWNAHRRRDDMSLLERLDYHRELSAQLARAPIRVLYAASGTNPAAAILSNGDAVIEHALYWSPVESIEEARYLTVVLNSDTLRRGIADRQARGQWGARHFDKLLVSSVPRFEERNRIHRGLSRLGERAEQVAAAVQLPDALYFVTARRRIRDALATDGVAGEIERLVASALG